MPGTLIAAKTSAADQRIDDWWEGITGSKSEALKIAVYFYLDNFGRRFAAETDPAPISGISADLIQQLIAVIERQGAILQKLEDRLDNPITVKPSVNGNGHKPKAMKPAPVIIDEAPATEDELEAATGNFLSAFG